MFSWKEKDDVLKKIINGTEKGTYSYRTKDKREYMIMLEIEEDKHIRTTIEANGVFGAVAYTSGKTFYIEKGGYRKIHYKELRSKYIPHLITFLLSFVAVLILKQC